MRPFSLALAAFFLTATVAAVAETPLAAAPLEPRCPAIDPPPATRGASSIVARDPVTGQLRPPTAEERQRLLGRIRPLLSRAEPHETRILPDGTRQVSLGDRFLTLSMARRGADGRLQQACVSNERQAAAFLEAGSATAPAPAAKISAAEEK